MSPSTSTANQSCFPPILPGNETVLKFGVHGFPSDVVDCSKFAKEIVVYVPVLGEPSHLEESLMYSLASEIERGLTVKLYCVTVNPPAANSQHDIIVIAMVNISFLIFITHSSLRFRSPLAHPVHKRGAFPLMHSREVTGITIGEYMKRENAPSWTHLRLHAAHLTLPVFRENDV